jgi:hypothetical protein
MKKLSAARSPGRHSAAILLFILFIQSILAQKGSLARMNRMDGIKTRT